MKAGLTAIVAGNLLDANNEGFQLKASCGDVGQAEVLPADVRLESVE